MIIPTRGGTRLTVEGDHFDSIAKSLLKVDKVEQMIEISGKERSVINETITTYFEVSDFFLPII